MTGVYQSIRKVCCEANRQLPELGIVDLTFGNVSVCDREAGVFAIKPSGVAYVALQPSDMVICRLGGNHVIETVEGSLRPSSDTPTHKYLYQAFPESQCVIHTHSRHATAFAQAGRAIPCLGTTHADYFEGEVPVTRAMQPEEVAENYEWQTGKVIAELFETRDPARVTAALVRSHGPFVWGHDAKKALETAFVLEVVAQMAATTLNLQPSNETIPPWLLDKHFSRKHGPSAYYGQR